MPRTCLLVPQIKHQNISSLHCFNKSEDCATLFLESHFQSLAFFSLSSPAVPDCKGLACSQQTPDIHEVVKWHFSTVPLGNTSWTRQTLSNLLSAFDQDMYICATGNDLYKNATIIYIIIYKCIIIDVCTNMRKRETERNALHTLSGQRKG